MIKTLLNWDGKLSMGLRPPMPIVYCCIYYLHCSPHRWVPNITIGSWSAWPELIIAVTSGGMAYHRQTSQQITSFAFIRRVNAKNTVQSTLTDINQPAIHIYLDEKYCFMIVSLLSDALLLQLLSRAQLSQRRHASSWSTPIMWQKIVGVLLLNRPQSKIPS